jgi:DNA modification methylase
MRKMPADSIDTIITSPPYWSLRDYGVDGQMGLEPTLEEYHERMLEVTAECIRVLKPTGVMFWNHGDSYEDKSLNMQNERLIIKMVDNQGWILRNRMIWNKPNGMPSSVTDRFSNKYEPVYMLVKSKQYWFDLDAVRKPYTEPINRWGGQKLKANGKSEWDKGTGQESYRDRDMRPNPLGKNPGNVWTIPTQPYPESHFATFPTALIEPMIKAACPAEICPVCGMARERIVDSEFVLQQDVSKDKGVRGANDQKPMDVSNKWQGVPRGTTTYHTVGWTSCDCGADWIAGTVLDPFAGSGTVGEVARNLCRNAILLELNPDYGRLISDRTMAHTPPLTAYFGEEHD